MRWASEFNVSDLGSFTWFHTSRPGRHPDRKSLTLVVHRRFLLLDVIVICLNQGIERKARTVAAGGTP
jgi:hypothetical protein